MREGRLIEIRGTVQGVGFRPWVWRLAHELGLAGRVRNDATGVHIEAFGPPAPLDTFLRRLARPGEGPPAAEISSVAWWPIPPSDDEEFVITASEASGEDAERRLPIPPDLATCEACRAEIHDPADRRYGYPFTNCTACGPRFTIALDVPYDRAATSMAPFTMCPTCAAEYGDPLDRRFHAQPNACPACGPRLRLLDADGQPAPGDPLIAAAAAIASGLIVAVKGLGGYHLACDATLTSAVDLLRDRKRRREKPFAVMVRDLTEAGEVAELDPESSRLLASPQRPIVLVPRRGSSRLSPRVAPDVRMVGLLLPYTPLHHLLLGATGRPLVMTSGNLSDEPIVIDDAQAVERLGGIADLILTHDRAIAGRCDDSVVRVIAGRATVLRRSRGWVPAAVRLAQPVPRPILAVGADLKNTFCIARGDEAYLGPHIGDLEGVDNQLALEEAVARMSRILRVEPEVIAHDLHPGYHSTAWALARPEPKIGVQHHHAHVAAAMAEHGLTGTVLGLAWDGTGWGGDGTAWGGELLLGGANGFQRLATFRPVALAGGDAAIRQIWRPALAALDDAFAGGEGGSGGAPPLDRLPLFDQVPASHIEFVRRMIARGLNSPRAHGVGRWFDVVAALTFARAHSQEEGHAALRLELAAAPAERGAYPFELLRGDTTQIDLRPTVRAITWDLISGRPASIVSARFHNTLIAAAAELVMAFARVHGEPPVVLTGGCFQNARLTAGMLAALAPRRVYRHLRVPPGDGGIALGQAVVAAARLSERAERRSGGA